VITGQPSELSGLLALNSDSRALMTQQTNQGAEMIWGAQAASLYVSAACRDGEMIITIELLS
jgi:hypothetical protein